MAAPAPDHPWRRKSIFAGYAQDPEVVRYLTWRLHRSLADTEAYIARCLAAPTDLIRTYSLVGRAEGRLLGAFDLRRPEAAPDRLRLCLGPPVVAPRADDRGFGSGGALGHQ